jgi:hypothetical protein
MSQVNHPALPLSILLALVATALMWGWPFEASILSLTWAGILRIGEVLIADRSDLFLLPDMAPGTAFALLRIKYPKTRGRAARHEAARVDPPDVVALLNAVFKRINPDQKLWPLQLHCGSGLQPCLLRLAWQPRNVRENGFSLSDH